jgi:hypothetical protein
MCFSSVRTSVEDRRTHQSGDLRFHFPHPKFTSKRGKRRTVVGEENQQLETHDTEKSYQHVRAPTSRLPTAENRAPALAGVAWTAVATVAKYPTGTWRIFCPRKRIQDFGMRISRIYVSRRTEIDWSTADCGKRVIFGVRISISIDDFFSSSFRTSTSRSHPN